MFYRYIGSGSGRNVFDLKNGYVMKVAKNISGIAQNVVECRISSMENSNLFARVVDASQDFRYLIMEKAEKINNFSPVLRYFNVTNNYDLLRSRKIHYIQRKYNLLGGDLCRCSSWGIINGRPVIVDYGFTAEVSDTFY